MKATLTRAEFLQLTLGAFVIKGPANGGRYLANQAGDDRRSSRVARVIGEYDGQGVHRTATDTDHQSARWLLDQATGAGAEARLEAFSLGRVDVRSAYVEADGRRVEGLPFFDGSFTDARGVSGRLGAPETHGEVALVVIDAGGISSEGLSLEGLRRSNDHRGIIAITNGAHPGLSPSNAAAFSQPHGMPVLQVSSDERRWLTDLAASGHQIRLVVDAVRTPAEATNVVATIAGREPALAPVVVMTPRSGWWHCASERGGGLACWLEVMRAVAAVRPRRTLVAIASSGHELGHFGLDAFLTGQPGLVKRATWIHLGANIGAARGVARLQASDDAIEAIADGSLSRAGAAVGQRVPRGTRPAGEARNIHDAGGRYVSLLGSGPFFHSLADRWPAAVDVPAVTRFCEAFADLAVRLSNE